MRPKPRLLSPRWEHLAWVAVMVAPLVMLAFWGFGVIDAERKSLWNEAKRKAELLAQVMAKLPLPRDAIPRLPTLPCVYDPTFFYPELPEPQLANEAQQLFNEGHYERLLDGQFSGQLSSAGVPIGPLAALILFRQASAANDIIRRAEQVAEMAIVRHPSILTETLLAEISDRLQRENVEIQSLSRLNELVQQWQREESVRRTLKQHETAILQQTEPTWYANEAGEKSYWIAITSIDPSRSKKELLVLDANELHAAMLPRVNKLLKEQSLSVPCLYELYAHNAIVVTSPSEQLSVPVTELVAMRANAESNFGVRILVNEAALLTPLAALQRRVWLTVLFSGCALVFGIWRTKVAFQRQQELAEQKDNFLSSVSHELRAPLGSVRLMAEGLASDRLDEGDRSTFQQLILLETQRLSSLVENLLDFARMEQGRRQYQIVDTNLTQLLRDTVRSLEVLAAKRDIRFHLAVEAIETEVDPLAVQQAIVNLLDNAIKFSPDRGTIHIALRICLLDWELTVQDEGPGVPVAERKKIFERFYRVGSELRRTTTGVGIGLSIVKHIVEGHGGVVFVEGEPGSRFKVSIPLRRTNP